MISHFMIPILCFTHLIHASKSKEQPSLSVYSLSFVAAKKNQSLISSDSTHIYLHFCYHPLSNPNEYNLPFIIIRFSHLMKKLWCFGEGSENNCYTSTDLINYTENIHTTTMWIWSTAVLKVNILIYAGFYSTFYTIFLLQTQMLEHLSHIHNEWNLLSPWLARILDRTMGELVIFNTVHRSDL